MTRSDELYERALRVLPGGVSRNTVLWRPHPFYAVRGEGCWVTDIEGVRRLDFANNMCSLVHGHAHPAIVAAITEQAQRGTAFTFATEAEVLYAEHMCGRSPSFEKIRFVNSGTEAVMSCLKAARAFTGRAEDRQGRGRLSRPLRLRRGQPDLQPGRLGRACSSATAIRWRTVPRRGCSTTWS